jgi:HK97 gp10 family phage protein
MVSKVSFRVEGAKQIEAALKELGPVAAGRVARSALNRSATPIVRRARELVPVRTSALKKAITKRLRRQRRGSSRQEALVGIERPASRYAHIVEFGSARQAAKPYLRPAADEKASEALDKLGENLGRGIEREALKIARRNGVL